MRHTRKHIEEALKFWRGQLKKLDEALYDGVHLPRRYAVDRHDAGKKACWYIGVDYGVKFSNYGHYVMPGGRLTADASNRAFSDAAKTVVPETARRMAEDAVEKWGRD